MKMVWVRQLVVMAVGLFIVAGCQGEKTILGSDTVTTRSDVFSPPDVGNVTDTIVLDTVTVDTRVDGESNPDTSPDPCLEHCTNGQADCGENGVDCGAGCGPCSTCGDGSCDPPGETPSLCCQDCAQCCVNADCTKCAPTEIATCTSGYCFCTEKPVNCGDGTCSPGETACGCPQDCPTFCGDGCCSGNENACGCPQECPSQCGDGCCTQGENACGCPGDCNTQCGDGCCTAGENACGCPQECAATCGDGCCTGGETACTCPNECGSQCGDGCCSAGETAAGCCGDCGQCCTNGQCPACPNGGLALCQQGQCSCIEDPGPTVVCGDKKCAPGKEDCGTCPGDCPCPAGKVCKNNQCADPSIEPACGDGSCAPGEEDCGTCPGDCPCPPGTSCKNNQCAAGCTPNCNGKACGNDGCSGSCGSCPGTQKCNSSGQCVDTCTPNCNGKACGNDGCSGSCGSCPGTQKCNSSGQCVADCTPNCNGKACGNDGCSGSCGSCSGSDTCNSAGQCVCNPKCGGKQCGNNGCGGQCGSCSSNEDCSNNQCVPKVNPVGVVPDFKPSCGGCGDGEACVLGQCAPVAVVLVSGDTSPSFVCPSGYSLAGRWRTSAQWENGYVDGQDPYGYLSDGGWAYLCSAKPNSVYMAVNGSDCGGATTLCGGSKAKGDFHVGQGCNDGVVAIDGKGKTLKAGWMRLCVEDSSQVKLEPTMSDCGESLAGCGGWQNKGGWHTVPGSCTSGTEGAGASGTAIQSGWLSLCVNSGRFPPVNPDTIQGKTLFGYQGWFAAPGDGANVGWRHWFHAGKTPVEGNATFDLWPDMSELDDDEKFSTSMTLPNGQPAKLFSSAIQKTVRRHFRWMAQAGIDGVFLQRFISELKDPAHLALRNKITANVAAGATEHGRVFGLMYDISGVANNKFQTDGVERIISDWEMLVDDMGMTNSPAYLHQGGKPVVAIWGLGFKDRPGTVDQAKQLINYFQSTAAPKYRAYVVGGVPFDWRTGGGDVKPGYSSVFDKYDLVSPWSVGRYGNTSGFDNDFSKIQGDKNYTASKGIGYAPVAWPGFSWVNLKKTFNEFNKIPRNGGKLFWHQAKKLHSINPTFLYIAMFDEVDESTAMFKAATTGSQTPTSGTWLTLGQDGYNLPSDWYLRLGGAITGAMDGRYTPKGDLPFDPP